MNCSKLVSRDFLKAVRPFVGLFVVRSRYRRIDHAPLRFPRRHRSLHISPFRPLPYGSCAHSAPELLRLAFEAPGQERHHGE